MNRPWAYKFVENDIWMPNYLQENHKDLNLCKRKGYSVIPYDNVYPNFGKVDHSEHEKLRDNQAQELAYYTQIGTAMF